MKKKLVLLFALSAFLMIASFAGAADYNQEQILKELEELKQTVKAQEQKIQQLKSAMGETQEKKAEQKADTKAASGEGGKVTVGNSLIDQLEIKSDLRVRYEMRDRDNPDDSYGNLNRWRARFRAGGIWKNKTESWEAGAGLATGTNTGTGTNDTWGEELVFEKGDIRLDYAYAKHKIQDFSFTIGQQINPFEMSWLFWDTDLRPTGLTAQYFHPIGLFATLGTYSLRFYAPTTAQPALGNDTAMLYAGQVGYKNKIGDVSFLAAAAYQHFDTVFSNAEMSANPAYDFRIGDLYAKASIPLGIVELSPYGQIWCNFGADGRVGRGQAGSNLKPGDEDLGWIIGLDGKIQQFKLGYAYADVGADSVYDGLKDADFGSGLGGVTTDSKGHRISAFYDVTKNISTGVTAFFYEAAERKNKPDVDLFQFDVNYKF
jgi:hypothetical protein